MNLFSKYKYSQKSYSQCGEDIIINFLLRRLGLDSSSIFYIDIGAHHPYYLSNTAFFYEKGASGILIEPDPVLFKLLKKSRKNDICLNLAISQEIENNINLYIMSTPTLNTTSYEEAKKYEREGYKIKDIIQVPCNSLNKILEKFAQKHPNLISIDAEGIDEIIINNFDFKKWRPDILCIETLEFTTKRKPYKHHDLIKNICDKGYQVYADTFINTIFYKGI